MDTLASTGADMLIQHGIPGMGKKAVEIGRYYGSEALRNPKLQKKAIDYALSKATLFIQKTWIRDVGSIINQNTTQKKVQNGPQGSG